ncbi:Outer membrane beta-barrel assembly protein BamD [hydrothermal vent metagenome]|uniref:Outer membrane beta-barrel assembly protein BamD n=1 Tax=hydrothermal vent metagenome TaxID=652676 RepID=A0A3B0XFT8_9ZZZZ
MFNNPHLIDSQFMMRIFSVLILSLFLLACSDDDVKEDPYADWTAQEFYDEATDALDAGEFEKAITNLENLEARFPFNPYARQAQLDIAYAYYKFDEPESAISAADRFIRLNPRDPHVDYAWYLKGLADYNRGVGFLDSFFTRDISLHDNKSMQQALSNFSTLVERYPQSRYAANSYQHMIFLRNKLAKAELHAANYYMKRKAWLAAARRGQYIIENYPTTPASREALEVMVKSYTELGLSDLAADAQSVLDKNPLPEEQLAVADDSLDSPEISD